MEKFVVCAVVIFVVQVALVTESAGQEYYDMTTAKQTLGLEALFINGSAKAITDELRSALTQLFSTVTAIETATEELTGKLLLINVIESDTFDLLTNLGPKIAVTFEKMVNSVTQRLIAASDEVNITMPEVVTKLADALTPANGSISNSANSVLDTAVECVHDAKLMLNTKVNGIVVTTLSCVARPLCDLTKALDKVRNVLDKLFAVLIPLKKDLLSCKGKAILSCTPGLLTRTANAGMLSFPAMMTTAAAEVTTVTNSVFGAGAIRRCAFAFVHGGLPAVRASVDDIHQCADTKLENTGTIIDNIAGSIFG